MNEAAASVKLTPYAKSYIRLQNTWTKEELDKVVDDISKNVKNNMKYEINFHGKASKSKSSFEDGKKQTLSIYRRGDDVILKNMDASAKKDFKKEIQDLLKGTDMKVVGDSKSADWMAVLIEPK